MKNLPTPEKLHILAGLEAAAIIKLSAKTAELSLTQLCKKVGLSRMAVNLWERGRSRPTTSSMEKIRKAVAIAKKVMAKKKKI